MEKTKTKKKLSLKAKIRIVLILHTIFIFFASCIVQYGHNLDRIRSQTSKTMEFVEKLLPYLEENEEDLKDLYAFFLESREAQSEEVLEDEGETAEEFSKEDLLAEAVATEYYEPSEDPSESFDALLSEVMSKEEQLSQMGFATGVQLFAFSPEDGTVIAHPYEYYKGLHISYTYEERDDITRFSFDDLPIGGDVMGTVSEYDGMMIAATLPELDNALSILSYSIQITAFITFILCILGKYVYYYTRDGRYYKPEYRHNVAVISLICVVMVFVITAFWHRLSGVTEDYSELENRLEDNAYAQKRYASQNKELSKWLDTQYLIQCRMVADEIKDKKESLTREDLRRLSAKYGVEYIYVIDKYGKVVLTDSPYDHFTLGKDKDSQSAAFRPLLNGVDHVVQPPMKDEVSGEKRQYIGVSIRDKNDLADGCVLISIDSDVLNEYLAPLSPSVTLKYALTDNVSWAFLVDRDTHVVTESSDGVSKDFGVEMLRISEKRLSEGRVWTEKSLGGSIFAVKDMGDEYLVLYADPTNYSGSLRSSAVLTGYVLAIVFILCILGYLNYTGDPEEIKTEESEKAEDDKTQEQAGGELIEDERGALIVSRTGGEKERKLFEERWKKHVKKPEEMNAGELALESVKGIAVVFSVIFLFPLLLNTIGLQNQFNSVLAYVISGNWDRGFNIFSIAQCVLLIAGMLIFNMVFKQILYQIARLSNTRVETICLLLRNSFKYVCIVIAIYYILAQMGIKASTLIASAGVISLVIGIGAKDIFSDLLSGFFIIVERSFDVGDYISLKDIYGVVTEIGLRTTKIALYGDTAIINNSEIRRVINQSGDVMRISVDVPIPHDESLRRVEEVLNRELPDMLSRVEGLIRAPRYSGITDFNGSGTVLHFNLYTVGRKRFSAKRAFLRELKIVFEDNDIKFSSQW